MPVAITIELGVERPHTQGSIDDKVERFFWTVKLPDEMFGPAGLSSGYRRSLSLWLRLRGCEAERSSAPSAEGKSVWSCHMPSVRHRAGLPLSNARQPNYGRIKTVTRHQYNGIRVPSRVCVCVCFSWTIQNHFLSLTEKLCVCWPLARGCCFIQCRVCLWSARKPTALVFWFTFFIDCLCFCCGRHSDRMAERPVHCSRLWDLKVRNCSEDIGKKNANQRFASFLHVFLISLLTFCHSYKRRNEEEKQK